MKQDREGRTELALDAERVGAVVAQPQADHHDGQALHRHNRGKPHRTRQYTAGKFASPALQRSTNNRLQERRWTHDAQAKVQDDARRAECARKARATHGQMKADHAGIDT